ncbi:MAG: PAS domain S-box protein [Mariprofundaceae bacterium]
MDEWELLGEGASSHVANSIANQPKAISSGSGASASLSGQQAGVDGVAQDTMNVAHIHFLQSMDQINNVIAQAVDLDGMLSDVLQVMLDIFQCDRAWLLYPCDPDSEFWEVIMECTRLNWPGATGEGVQFPMTEQAAVLPRMCLASTVPLRFDRLSGLSLPDVVKSFGVQAQMCMAIYPKVDKAWMFGIHHCEVEYAYSDQESRLFEQIGCRIADALNTLLVMRELKKSQALHLEAQRLARIGHWELDMLSNKLTWSDEVHRMFETDAKKFDATYEAFLGIVHPDDRALVDKTFRASLHSEQQYTIDHRLLMPDGRVKYVHELCRTYYDQLGKPLRSVGTVQDITERKQTENALWESQQRLQAILDNTAAVIYLKDREGKYLLINRRFEQIFHLRTEEIIGLFDHDIFPTDIADAFRANDLKVLAAERAMEFEEKTRQEDGDHSYISVKFPLFGNEGVAYAVCGVSTDITGHKRSEELERLRLMELGHRARLSIVGEMSAQIAHELHQPLSAIRSYSDACLYLLKANEPDIRAFRDVMNKIGSQAVRAGKIMNSVQQFAQKQEVQRTMIDVNMLVRDTLSLMEIETDQYLTKPTLKAGRKLPAAYADKILIQQVLLNLVRNASQSMVNNMAMEWSLIIQTRVFDDDALILSVTDRGRGMAEDEIEQVFDPFYSRETNGMGLGLALSRMIVESHGGRIWAEANAEGGMTFCFTLPTQGE